MTDPVLAFSSLESLIRMKRAAGRPKDRIEIEVLEAVLLASKDQL